MKRNRQFILGVVLFVLILGAHCIDKKEAKKREAARKEFVAMYEQNEEAQLRVSPF